MIARGLTNKEIASHLNLFEQTVKNHIHRMLRRIGANDRSQAVELAYAEAPQLENFGFTEHCQLNAWEIYVRLFPGFRPAAQLDIVLPSEVAAGSLLLCSH
jgi:hypothetical protein